MEHRRVATPTDVHVPHFVLQPRTSGSELRHTQLHRTESYEPSSQTPSLCLRQSRSFLQKARSTWRMERARTLGALVSLSLPPRPPTLEH